MDRSECARSRRGFTLIEIMAVVLIIGLLSSIVGLAIFQQVDRGRVTATRAQLASLEGVLELYRMDNARFPTTEQGLDALVHQPSSEPKPRNYPPGGYLKGGRVPLDPWGEPYHYESPGQHNQHFFDLWSYGANGQPGGEGVDADIGNWADDEMD
jgi:general secretion pathway protein G